MKATRTSKDISPDERASWLAKAKTLSEALPYMREFAGSVIVVKYGGHAMGEEQAQFARDVVLLRQVGISPVVVHGGGPQIAAMLKRLNIESNFVDGLRVTDKETMEVVEMVLSGTINKQIVSAINLAGGFAVGLSGKDGHLMQATKVCRAASDVDLGFVGEPSSITPHIIEAFMEADIVPVIAPIGVRAEGETYNINADTVAGAVAAALTATRLLMLTDVPGVLDKDGKLITEMSSAQARELIADGTIKGGMIPKVETCLDAVDRGVEAAVILDGRVQHAILLEIFTPHGVGTLIRAE